MASGIHNSKLRILFLTQDKYPPFRPAAKAIFTNEFQRRGHKVDWLVQAEHSSFGSGELIEESGTVYLAKTIEDGSVLSRIKKYLFEFLNNLRVLYLPWRKRYDLIQVKDRYVSATIALVSAKITRTPYFYWLAYPHAEAHTHEAQQGFARYPLLYRLKGFYQSVLLYRVLLPFADHVFVQSEQMRSDIAEHGIARSKMTAVPGSVALSEIPYENSTTQSESSTNESTGPDVVLYVGTLIRERHLEFLIQSFARTLQAWPNAILRLVGKGENPEDEAILRAEVTRLQLEAAVDFVGQVPMVEVFDHIKCAKVCVSPYYPSFILNSTSPTKLIEYMAMAKPVVGNDHPEQTDIINQSGAGYISQWEPREFGEKVYALLADPSAAAKLGRAGRKWVENNRTNLHMADLVESTYSTVLNRPTHPQ